jgi:transcriptional regulator GlxA family with amidase domain
MQTSFTILDHAHQNLESTGRAVAYSQFCPPARQENGAGRLNFFANVTDHAATAANKIDASIGYMNQHLNRPMQVATLAAMVNISPSHYFALFKRHTGRAPMDYFTRLRMEEARRLLDTTPSSVKEVAAALGYDDPFYFSRVFKSVNQLAPSNYRSKQKARNEPGENYPCKT